MKGYTELQQLVDCELRTKLSIADYNTLVNRMYKAMYEDKTKFIESVISEFNLNNTKKIKKEIEEVINDILIENIEE